MEVVYDWCVQIEFWSLLRHGSSLQQRFHRLEERHVLGTREASLLLCTIGYTLQGLVKPYAQSH